MIDLHRTIRRMVLGLFAGAVCCALPTAALAYCEDDSFDLAVDFENICRGESMEITWTFSQPGPVSLEGDYVVLDSNEKVISVRGPVAGFPKNLASSGSDRIDLEADARFRLKAGKCEGEQIVRVHAPNKTSTASYDGTWKAVPGIGLRIVFQVRKGHFSSGFETKAITPVFHPKIQDKISGQVFSCDISNGFLNGFQTNVSYGFALPRPFQSHVFGVPFHPEGTWRFEWLARCPGFDLTPKPNAAAPFDLLLQCSKP